MKIGIGLVMGLAGLLGASLVAADEASSEATAAARHVAVTICATCHGPQGHAISPKFPQLAGQRATYLVAQMKNFRSQSRGDPDALAYMWGMAAASMTISSTGWPPTTVRSGPGAVSARIRH